MSPSKRSFRKKSIKTDIEDLPRPPSLLDQIDSSFSPPPNLPPPPIESQDILTRPPVPESPTKPFLREQYSFIIQDNITSDILDELRQADFGSFLHTVPEEKRPNLTLDEVESPLFLAAKDAYLAAGKKHLELNFYENAAMNFSCAILSMFLGLDVFAAAHLISEIAVNLPSSIVNSQVFQGAKLLLKGNLLKNSSFLIQGVKWLLKDPDHLYTEDKDLIHRAFRQSEINIKPD